jgi:GNAT superfamily N-acetyltransferase
VGGSDTAAMEFLAADKLRNIHLLKMLAVYPAQARAFVVNEAGDHAVLVRLPVAVAGYDREHYPDTRWIGVISARQVDLARQVIARARQSSDHAPGRWVFKCMDSAAVDAVRSFGTVTRATSFISFTGAASPLSRSKHEVHATREPTKPLVHLLSSSGGYAREEVLSFFRQTHGWGYWIGEAGAPKAVCMSFALHEDVYEIAALYTCPQYRRNGYARSLVNAAWADLRERRLLLRYQAREDNEPSIALARALGLNEFLRLDHWLTQDVL